MLVAVVFGINLMPAFGPPTWSVLVLYRFNSHLNPVALVGLGALAAASGRYVLAEGTRRLGGHLSEERRRNLDAVRRRLERRRAGTAAALGLFALSPLPSAQLFEAAGLMGLKLSRFVAAFFAGRLVSYSLYVVGASALSDTTTGTLLRRSFTDWRAVALQVALLAGVVALTRVNWLRLLGGDGGDEDGADDNAVDGADGRNGHGHEPRKDGAGAPEGTGPTVTRR